MSFNLYMMVSIPEEKREHAYDTPYILGVFDSKEKAKAAWKARTPEFKHIKAKTVHIYYEVLSTEAETLPESVYVWAYYRVHSYSILDDIHMSLIPYTNGFFETYEQYKAKRDWLDSMHGTKTREFCESVGYTFYAANDNIIEKCPLNRLVQIPVELTDRNDL